MDTPRQRYLKRLKALKDERQSWWEHWRELADYLQPRRGRFLSTDRNKGWKKNQNVINNRPLLAVRTLQSGMMAGITSPARPWFRLTVSDPGLTQNANVRAYLDVVEERIRDVFAKSNIYNCLHALYGDLAVFGTSALHIEEDFEDVVRGYVFPVGQYCLANSKRLQVDTAYRELGKTVGQLVEEFGEEKCSPEVRDMYKNGQVDTWVNIIHIVEPNTDYAPGKVGPKGMPWRSCWFEANCGYEEQGSLRESGFFEFSVCAPRWEVTGEDVYGSSPGMSALPDVKALQLYEKRKAQAVDKIVNPPMKAPASLMNMKVSILSGDVTYIAENQNGQTFEPAMVINPAAITVAQEQVVQHEQRVNAAFYADLWLMLSESEGDMTAREVAERHEEKMLQLGPVMERLENELLNPLIRRTYGILVRTPGQLPRPPRELQGQSITIEYISIMAQAQKAVGNTSIERLTAFVANLAAIKPEAADKLDQDALVDGYADGLGVKSNLLVTDDQVAAMRQQRAQAQQAQAQAQNMLAATQGAKNLASSDLSGNNALSRLVGPVAAASAEGGDS